MRAARPQRWASSPAPRSRTHLPVAAIVWRSRINTHHDAHCLRAVATERLTKCGRGASSTDQAWWSRSEQDERAICGLLGRSLDGEREHLAVAQDRFAHESAVGARHSRPNDRRLLAVAKLQMSAGRFRVVKRLKDRVCLRIDQSDNCAFAKSRGNLELHLAAACEVWGTFLIGRVTRAIEDDAGVFLGASDS